MFLAAVVSLVAAQTGPLQDATGTSVHGLWFRQWKALSPSTADLLHSEQRRVPYTLSPLMGPSSEGPRGLTVSEGQSAWFRVTSLQSDLSVRLQEEWLPRLPDVVPIAGLDWKVTHVSTRSSDHPWAGAVDPIALADMHLRPSAAPTRWDLEFATPTAFHGSASHLPFPLPDALVGSWLRRWQAFGAAPLREDLAERARAALAVSAYRLETRPIRYMTRVLIGCVGGLTMRAIGMSADERAAVDLLAAFGFWCGGGHHTTQGMGMMRLLPTRRRAASDDDHP